MIERRRQLTPSTPAGLLQQLPARILLDRLPTPMLAVGFDGVLFYANPACATMLGYTEIRALTRRTLPALLTGHANTSPRDCVAALQAAGGAVTAWCHTHGFTSTRWSQSHYSCALTIRCC